MNNGLSGIKNVIWALAIVAALIALLIGLIFTFSVRYYGDKQDGTMLLGSGTQVAAGNGKLSPDDGSYSAQGSTSAQLNELPSTQDAGLEYVFGLTFLCDKTFTGINSYSEIYGGSAAAQIWTDDGTGLPAASAASTSIVLDDGTRITPANAAAIYQPKRLVIYIGSDYLSSATQESFVSGYEQLINSIRSASSETTIICCSIASVGSSYPGADGLTPSLISDANEWIKQVCSDTGVYYADLASLLNDSNGCMADEYVSPNGRSIGSSGIAKVVEYFRMHGV